ncbi:RNA polymerase sigma factor RpoD/SigA [Oscillochloris sp. ZM17-4]|uniref:sigma-70 family RNA polymerase sigma factor n=1 Tax=Oscillochloris sp. ZM17-4 TaxID=2866714 RepID=UPI00351D2F64
MSNDDDDSWVAEAEIEEPEDRDNEPVEDSVQLYLHEIGQVALLKADEERDLAMQIVEGKAARRQLDDEDYADGRERAILELKVARGLDSRRKLIQANLRLVVSVAKKYIGSPMAFMDLVQEGNIGLMRAVEKFDYTRGNRFSTYATWWIRQAVTRSIAEQSRLIRLPVHLSESLVHLRRAIYKLEQELEREPTPQEIAHTMGLSLRKVKRLLQASTQPVSLEQPLNNESEGRVGEVLADESLETPMEIAAQNMLHQELSAALNDLPERERKILQLRYGLIDGQRRTLEEVGVAFGITRERTRQIEAEAMRRLRHPSVGQRLHGYLD